MGKIMINVSVLSDCNQAPTEVKLEQTCLVAVIEKLDKNSPPCVELDYPHLDTAYNVGLGHFFDPWVVYVCF
jgi:hypothetical protein